MINIDLSSIIELGESFDRISKTVLDENIKQGLVIAGMDIQSAARSLVPVDTSALKLSITNSIGDSGLSASVGPTQPYGKDIELGRKPGTYVSPNALMGWAKRKGLNPYAVSKSIERKGSPAQPFMFPAADARTENVFKIITQAIVNAFTNL